MVTFHTHVAATELSGTFPTLIKQLKADLFENISFYGIFKIFNTFFKLDFIILSTFYFLGLSDFIVKC